MNSYRSHLNLYCACIIIFCLLSATTAFIPAARTLKRRSILGITKPKVILPQTIQPYTRGASAKMMLFHPAVVHAAEPVVAAAVTAAGAEQLTTSAFLQAFSLIFVSEIGDKTFFIAGLLAMKTNKAISFVGSVGALTVMTIISVVIGQLFHAVPSSLANGVPFDDIAAIVAFAYFGIRSLKEAYDMPDDGSESINDEFTEAEEAVEKDYKSDRSSLWAAIIQTFILVFTAEIGDRSFISTIALSAAQNPIAVATGAIVAHAVATVIAVIGGAILSKYISEKLVGYIGGTLFLIFALTTAIGLA